MSFGSDELRALYRRDAKALLIFFESQVHDAEAALDLLVDSFVALIDERPRVRVRGEDDLRRLLWTIVSEKLDAHLARRHPSRKVVARRALAPSEIVRIGKIASLDHLNDALARAMHTLPGDLRQAVELRYFDNVAYPDIATRLHITEAVARTRVNRGLRLLAAHLRSDGEPT